MRIHMERVASRGSGVMLFTAAVAAALLMVPPFGAAAATGGGRCTTQCGNISIPYPFGVEKGCYLDGGFNLTCNESYDPPKLFLGDGTVQVLEISIPNGTVRIIGAVRIDSSSAIDFNNTSLQQPHVGGVVTWGAGLEGVGPYFLSENANSIVLLGCEVRADLLPGAGNANNMSLLLSVTAVCPDGTRSVPLPSGRCSGVRCFQASISLGYSSYGINLYGSRGSIFQSVYIAEEPGFNYTFEPGLDYTLDMKNGSSLEGRPALLGWAINNSTCSEDASAPECRSTHSSCSNYSTDSVAHRGYRCYCSDGYQGNPYVLGGCDEIDRCREGTDGDPSIKGRCIKKSFSGLNIGLVVSGGSVILFLALASPFITRRIKLRRVKKMKEKHFKQNHGLLLQQLISQKTDFGERMIITLAELEKATNNFDRTREVGGGGHGVVFKGILDLHVVAIKKSRIMVQREIEEFINEVAILSQVNHRNVVKLLGCCLEAEVPLLVYEFISNGTLSHHLHVEGPISLSWDDRLRIALEVARALSYLHSAALMPIFHRDIKSSNILLDDSLTAKVSDFGASRYIPIDRSGVTTAIQGTIGYLDPMYYYTGRLTEKSDVFSFGVLVIELLTRKKPFMYRSDSGDGLVSHFASLLAEGNLVDIVDLQVMEEEDGEVQEVAALAAICTKYKGEDRPTMREVEMILENLRVKKHAPPRVYDGDEIVARNMPTEGVATQEASRQYTMEEEIQLSSRYPR